MERLLRLGLTAEMLNDDSLGRALDRLYEAGLTDIFSQAASRVLRLWVVHHRFVHLDIPSLSGEGEDAKPEEQEVVRITSTSSRAKCPNLKQVGVAVLTGDRSALPPSMQALDGIAADPHPFLHGVEAYIAHLQEGEMPFLVADSALSRTDNLQRLARVRWLTCVPERIGLARALIEAVAAADMPPAAQEGHRTLALCTADGGVRRRWPVISAGVRDTPDTGIRERWQAEHAWKRLMCHEGTSRKSAERAVRRLIS